MTLRQGAPWVLGLVGLLWGGWQTRAAANAREAAGLAALAASNALAREDSTRAAGALVAKLLGDSLQAVRRLAVQETQRADNLDRALGLERRALVRLTVRYHAMTAESVSTDREVTEDSAGVRVGFWTVRDPPFTVEAMAALPPPPAVGKLTAKVGLDPLTLGLRLGCGKVGADGIRPAEAALTGPPWATLRLEDVTQSPELCPSPALAPRKVSRLKWAGIGAGVALVLTKGLGLLGIWNR